jgi:PAS domain S-box-containing protein
MPAAVRPSLEDLRNAAAPAWLWDAERRRIVWANQPGLDVFGCRSVSDLVSRPLDPDDPGIGRLAGLLADLSWSEPRRVQLHLPSTGHNHPFACDVYLQALADGRMGLLTVTQSQEVMVAGTAEAAPAHAVVDALPLAAAVVSPDGGFLRHNAAMARILQGKGRAALQAFLPDTSEHEGFLEAGSSGPAERMATFPNGGKAARMRLRLSPVASLGPGNMLLLLDPVFLDGRDPAPEAGTEPRPTTEAAFAALRKTLSDTLREPPAAVATATAAARLPFPVHRALQNAPQGVIVARQGLVLYANTRASSLYAPADPTLIAAQEPLPDALAAVPPGREAIVVSHGPVPLAVTRHAMPWHNGPAEQFTLRPLAPTAAAPQRTASAPAKAKTGDIPPTRHAPPARPPGLAALPAPAADRGPEDAAKEREAIALDELKAILDVASDGIITLGSKGEVLTFSAACEAIFGVTTREASGRPLQDMLHEDSRRLFRDYLEGLRGPGLAAVFNDGREMRAINAQGGEIPLFITIGKLQSPHSRAAFCAVVRDLTPWKRTERDLLEARDRALALNRQKSDFLAQISHELRTPLNAILGFSDVMRTERFGPVGSEKYLAYANDIHASGSHLLAIVNDLLDLARVEAGRLELDFVAVNLEEVVDYALNLLQSEAMLAGIVLRKAISEGLPRIVADPKSLRQVVINLVSNGIKYTDAGGEVMVSAATLQDGALVLRVKDNGIGMSASQMEEALSPFGRVESAARPRPGTGLGLPLSKSLIEANRATFTLASLPGHGTLAEIVFPGPRVLAE